MALTTQQKINELGKFRKKLRTCRDEYSALEDMQWTAQAIEELLMFAILLRQDNSTDTAHYEVIRVLRGWLENEYHTAAGL